MTAKPKKRSVDDILATLREDLASAADLVGRGKDAFDSDRLLRLSAEAILGRVGEAAKLLPDDVADDLFSPDRTAWIAQRIIVDHVYHRLNYDRVWATLNTDVTVVAGSLAAMDDRVRNLEDQQRLSTVTKSPLKPKKKTTTVKASTTKKGTKRRGHTRHLGE